ncbi:RNA-guided endonuclease InsQ/TnpB family protein [Nitrosomonas cryotolerans]|uniref:RNA-guided endonuclease InsQ/TnpB family protein n=1 Tax=Nitrosomonas cryotolerans TaxID=44575 RepID=UPI00049087F8|nr:RNA-guided endonuclease TnpB family protein [Nitrosomonas cryotolerans]
MEIKRAYKFRFYPTFEQATMLAQTFGCAGFVYNRMLLVRSDAGYTEKKRIGCHATSSLLTKLKKEPEFEWLNKAPSVPVQQSLRHLQTAFGNFFAKRAKYPSFKRKYGRHSAEYTSSAFKWDGKSLKLEKMKDPLNIRWSCTLPKAAKLTTAMISKDLTGRYRVSMLCDDSVALKPKVSGKVGIGLGLTHFAILSTGEIVGIERWYPSSKRCLGCGHTVNKMPLNAREWTCPECGSIHDRDINAARNVLAAGLAVPVLGESISPVCI